MKLYLSSYRLAVHTSLLSGLASSGRRRAGIVFNACDVWGEQRLHNWRREADDLAGLGFRPEELDLRTYFGREQDLGDRLAELDLVWAVGGNSFVLARAMEASGFRRLAVPLIRSGQLAYAGYSAGSCVATPDLQGIELMDDPSLIPDGYPEVDPVCLGLVPFRIVPHWLSDHPEAPTAELAAARLAELGLPFRTLPDGEAITIDEPIHG